MSCHDVGSTEFCQKSAGGAVLTFQTPFKETTGCLTALAAAGSGTTTGLGQTGLSGIADASTAAGSARKIHLVFMVYVFVPTNAEQSDDSI
jgi:hypothetical protein